MRTTPQLSWRAALAAATALFAGAVVAPELAPDARATGSGEVRIEVLSTRADLVSDGDALTRIVLPGGARADDLRVDVDGRDVTSAFAARRDGRVLGVLRGLRVGRNVVTARLDDGRGARLTVTNAPRGGPVFSGPQIQPWTCAEGARDQQCNRPTTFELLYKSSNPAKSGFSSYDPADPPSDVATTTTDQGRTVPYIVRLETGVLARDQYKVAVLFDPTKKWDPTSPQPQFNRKLVITHGASCDTGYAQAEAPDVLNDTALSRGFAVMSHALNNAGHNCNPVTQAESMVMTKEHVVDTYGDLRYTIGSGCSGGALAQNVVANAYPGLYQGITTACSFPDSWSGRMLYEDYSLLRRYFENPTRWAPGVAWAPDDLSAVMGHPNYVNSIVYNTAINPILDPSRSCPGVPAEKVYNAETNPKGVRCSMQDYMVNVFGKRAKDGFANRPWDNTGVQYGLRALLAGKLTPAQFVDVNRKIGGRDIDYEPTEGRAVADRVAVGRAFRSGAVNTASNLDQVAILDLRGPDPGAFHDVYRTYALRARLDREHGTHANMVLWRGSVPLFGDASYQDAAILAMDQWLAKVERDRTSRPLPKKIIANKPAALVDRCSDGAGGGTNLPAEYCDAVVQSYSTARIEAGMPFTDDVIKCRLKPLRRSDYYPVLFSPTEWKALQDTFPGGVCDYAQPAVDYADTVPWMTYADGYGGRPLGAPPRSRALR